MVREAIAALDDPPLRPVFVGGSGFLPVEAARSLPEGVRPVYVDISSFQVKFFRRFLKALVDSDTPEQLRNWFSRDVYPVLKEHYRKYRGRFYSRNQVFTALEKLFRIDFFFQAEALQEARRIAGSMVDVQQDIRTYLSESGRCHDFICLSNVLDYLPREELVPMFGACRASGASVYALMTEACRHPRDVTEAWERAGYSLHPLADELTVRNRGLGSWTLGRSWNRSGNIRLLVPGA
ncbi:MAG: hypothetical protein GXP52_04000 [Deltaproteobacteria bacterium]|nr:hypothetical protein [Deltaproteobacteria bacterium]